jgi:hypothetical protein
VNHEELVKAVLNYQSERLREAVDDPVDSYIAEDASLRAQFLFAPYFPLTGDPSTLDLNIACLQFGKILDPEIAAIVPVTLSTLMDGFEQLVERYTAAAPKRLFIWLDDFDEDKCSEATLEIFVELVRRLSRVGILVFNLFGGFFSCIARDHGLNGFAHGLGYGENRSLTPVLGGGQPPPRYYFKPLHYSMSVLDAASLLANVPQADYLARVCDCIICTELLGRGDVGDAFAAFAETRGTRFAPKAYALNRFHFLLARHDEVQRFRTLSGAGKMEAIERDSRFLIDIGAGSLGRNLSMWRRFVG